MKQSKGIALIGLILVVVIILIVVLWGLKYAKGYLNNQQKEDTKATMLAIQTVITNVKNKHIVDEKENSLIGVKLDLENNETEYKITEDLKNVLSTMENAELYILNKEELNNLGVKNVEVNDTEFYIVDYNSEDIVYSLGVEGKYKLSDM
jgi:type II secretory pathway pseudopilin PulG